MSAPSRYRRPYQPKPHPAPGPDQGSVLLPIYTTRNGLAPQAAMRSDPSLPLHPALMRHKNWSGPVGGLHAQQEYVLPASPPFANAGARIPSAQSRAEQPAQAPARSPSTSPRTPIGAPPSLLPLTPLSAHKLPYTKADISSPSQAHSASTSPASSPSVAPGLRTKSSRYNMRPVAEFRVPVMLPTRLVHKTVDNTSTAAAFAALLMKEHRLEFDSDGLIIWEVVGDFRRPVRDQERLHEVMKAWDSRDTHFSVSSDALRHDEYSLASLTPRRDMLRQLPTVTEEEVSFSVPGEQGQLTWGVGSLSFVDGRLAVRQKYDGKLVCQYPADRSDVYELVRGKGPMKYTLAFKPRVGGRFVAVSTNSAKLTSELRNAIYTARTRYLLVNKLV